MKNTQHFLSFFSYLLVFVLNSRLLYGGVDIAKPLEVQVLIAPAISTGTVSPASGPNGQALPTIHVEFHPNFAPDVTDPDESMLNDSDHPRRNQFLKKEIEAANVVRATQNSRAENGPKMFFLAEVPPETDQNLLKFYHVSSKWRIMRNKYSDKILRCRDERLLDQILRIKPDFQTYSAEEKAHLKTIVSHVDLLIRKDSHTLYHGGPVSHVRRGTFAFDGDLLSPAIWIGEKMLDLPEETLAWLMLEQAQHILFPEREHGSGSKQIRHSAELTTLLEDFIRQHAPSEPPGTPAHTAYLTQDAVEDSREGFGFIRRPLSDPELKFQKFLDHAVSRRAFGRSAKTRLIHTLTHMSRSSLQIRQPFFPALNADAILKNKRSFNIRALIKELLQEKQRYLNFKDSSGKRIFSYKQIDLLLFKNLIPFAWIESFYAEGFSKNFILVLMEAWSNPPETWKDKKFDRDRLVSEGIPRHWATYMVLSDGNIITLWDQSLRRDRDRLVTEYGVPSLWATYLILVYKDSALTQWQDKFNRLVAHYVDQGFSKPKALYYSIIDGDIYTDLADRPKRHDHSGTPVGEFSEGFLAESRPDWTAEAGDNIFDDNNFGVPLGALMQSRETFNENLDDLRDDLQDKRRWLTDNGLTEPLVSYLLNAYRDPVDKWIKMKEVKELINTVNPGLSDNELNTLVFKMFNPKVIEDQVEARDIEKTIRRIVFGANMRGFRNYYQGRYFPSKLERNTAIVLQHFGLMEKPELGENWQVLIGNRSFDFRIRFHGNEIFLEPHGEPAGQFRSVKRNHLMKIFGPTDLAWRSFFKNPDSPALQFSDDAFEAIHRSALPEDQRVLMEKLYRTSCGRTLEQYADERREILAQNHFAHARLLTFSSLEELYRLLQQDLNLSVTEADLSAINNRISEAEIESDAFIYESLLLFWTGNKHFKDTLTDYSAPDAAELSSPSSPAASINKGGIDLHPGMLKLETQGENSLFPESLLMRFDPTGLIGFTPVIIDIKQ